LLVGITSLIREGLAAWDSHELGRLVFKYGGKPVGAFAAQPNQELAGDVAHALFLDWTHDNPSPAEKRTIPNMLPSAGQPQLF
jgi:glycogen debranching enzyme